jgi:hypothetical protein
MISELNKSHLINFALVSVLVFSVSEYVAAHDIDSQTIFSAPVNEDEEASVQDAEPAVHLGTFEIPHSNGRITFLDETPLAETPSISVVVVEDAGFSTIAEAIRSGASALELFQAFAPPKTKIPERIKLADYLPRDERGTGGDQPKSITTLRLYGPSGEPIVGHDDWGSGCNDREEWDERFSSWVSDFASLSTSIQSDEVNIPHATQGYGYFGHNDTIWLGVCMRTGNIMHVGMQYRQQNWWSPAGGNWVPVGGYGSSLTAADLHPGERYLYYSYKPFTAQRRFYVSATGDAEDGNGNWALISQAWRDDFAPDSNYCICSVASPGCC